MRAAVVHYISSSNDLDNQLIQVEGLDENWEEQVATVTLSGQAKTEISGTWIRINNVKNIDSTNFAGSVYVYEDDTTSVGVPDTDSKVRSVNVPEFQANTNTIYTVPANKTGFVLQALSNIGPTKSSPVEDKAIYIHFVHRDFGCVFQEISSRITSKYEPSVAKIYAPPILIPEKSDLKMHCSKSYVDNAKVYASYYLILKNN